METTQYTLHVTALEERRLTIAQRTKEATDRNNVRKEYKFRNGNEYLPVISLPENFLIYRLENYRTRDTQLSLIAAGEQEVGFFDPARREDPSVQARQHRILYQQAQTGSGESVSPIHSELRRV